MVLLVRYGYLPALRTFAAGASSWFSVRLKQIAVLDAAVFSGRPLSLAVTSLTPSSAKQYNQQRFRYCFGGAASEEKFSPVDAPN